MDILNPKKCQTCPYHLGLIKPKRDPCVDCAMSKRKEHPFSGIKTQTTDARCQKYGSFAVKNGKCALCGAKQTKLF